MTPIAKAIEQAPRCDRFLTEVGEPCDGLEGCEACLEIAAEAVRDVWVDDAMEEHKA